MVQNMRERARIWRYNGNPALASGWLPQAPILSPPPSLPPTGHILTHRIMKDRIKLSHNSQV